MPQVAIAGKPPLQTLKLDGSGFWGINFSPDGNALATSSGSDAIAIWKPDIGISFSPDGETIAEEDRHLCDGFL